MDKVNISIIGAGVIGLAIAEKLSRDANLEIVVFEQYPKFGQETSSRNSEVIHAGIYYPLNSLKSLFCLQGNRLLYDFCVQNNIKHKKCGKIIISTNDQEAKEIEGICANAQKVGVPELKLLTKEEVLKLEPNIFAFNGIYSGSTGIIDSHGLMDCFFKKAQGRNVLFAFDNEIVAITKTSEGYIICNKQGEEILSEKVINCAGLNSDKIAKIAGFDIEKLGYKLYPCKGDYFSISHSQNKLSHLVYPVPEKHGYGLGVHATLNLEGYIRLGPDTTYINEIKYDIDPAKAKDFAIAAQKYLPWLKEEMLLPDTAGIRPKLQGPNDGFKDFGVKEETEKGYPGFVNLIGIESPGLTSCLAIAEYVSKIMV